MNANQPFLKSWVKNNTIGFIIAFLVYTPIAHGLTGHHTRDLSSGQLIAHSVGLVVVSALVFFFQKRVLKHYIEISSKRIIASIILFVSLFWFGYYQRFIPDGPDYDILFAFLVLGSGSWLGLLSFKGRSLQLIIALVAFPIASFLGQLILYTMVVGLELFELELQTSIIDETIVWLSVGITTGLIGGWVNGKMLTKVLPDRRN
ncbi:hypothetical protein [Ekhidna sp.]